jgi:hypothetical protein
MKCAIIGAVVVSAAAFITPASAAPPVISDPGRCAQFYPNANCDNLGPGNPYTGKYVAGRYQLNHPGAQRSYGDHYAFMAPHRRHHHHHRDHH